MFRRRHLLSAVWCHQDVWRLWMARPRETPFYIVVRFPVRRSEVRDTAYVARCEAMATQLVRRRNPKRYDGKIVP